MRIDNITLGSGPETTNIGIEIAGRLVKLFEGDKLKCRFRLPYEIEENSIAKHRVNIGMMGRGLYEQLTSKFIRDVYELYDNKSNNGYCLFADFKSDNGVSKFEIKIGEGKQDSILYTMVHTNDDNRMFMAIHPLDENNVHIFNEDGYFDHVDNDNIDELGQLSRELGL